MPKFWRSFCGPRVTVNPQVISGATSSGQHCMIGILVRSTSSPCTTFCWQGAPRSRLVGMFSTCLNWGSLSKRSRKPFGGSGSFRKASNFPTSRRALTSSCPIPNATRRGVPNKLHSTGIVYPFGFSNSNAGPPARRVRSAISVISRWGSTGNVMRFNSPCCSSSVRKSRRSWYFMGFIMASC